MKYVILTLCLFASQANATPVAVWSGPGANACNGNCSQSWAESTLTDVQRADLAVTLANNPEPYPLVLAAGTVVSSMAYYRDGATMDRRGTVLLVDAPAMGWHVGDWTFARIDACGNWSVSHRGQAVGSVAAPVVSIPSGIVSSASAWSPLQYYPAFSLGSTPTPPVVIAGFEPDSNNPGTTTEKPKPTPIPPVVNTGFEPGSGKPPTTPKTPEPTPIPLPATGFLMLAAVGLLRIFDRPLVR